MTHYYKKDGKKLPSVTTIISDCVNNSAPLLQWSANCCKLWIQENCEQNVHKPSSMVDTTYWYKVWEKELDDMRFNFRKVSQKALDIGSKVHALIEKYLSNPDACGVWAPDDDKRGSIYKAMDAFFEWEHEHNLKPIALEQTVYGDGWAGTLDFYGYFNGKLYVIDWKSSKAHYPEMRYQVAAYKWATERIPLEEPFTYPRVDGCGVLRLDKETGLPDWKDTSGTYEKDLEIFNAMVNLYFKRHPIIERKARG